MSFWLQLPIEKKEKREESKKKIKCTYIKYVYNIFFKFFKRRKKNENSKNSLILEKWNTARSLYANLMAHTLAKENLTRLFYSSLKYRPVQHLLALLIVTPFFLIRATEWDKIYHGQLRSRTGDGKQSNENGCT